jgi:hypothetical protein
MTDFKGEKTLPAAPAVLLCVLWLIVCKLFAFSVILFYDLSWRSYVTVGNPKSTDFTFHLAFLCIVIEALYFCTCFS